MTNHPGFIRAYLRASTDDQNASRAREALEYFTAEKGASVASWYVENASGARADRTELARLIDDAKSGDVLLVEQVDRLTRLTKDDWDRLKVAIQSAGLRVVSLDLPTSHAALTVSTGDDFTGRMLDAVNAMLMDMLAAVARKDYEDRRRRQAEGIAKAREQGAYKGRPVDEEKHRRIMELRQQGFSIRKTADIIGCGVSTVQRAESRATAG
ncbi:Site-specific DNA recombinase [Franzmannia pantelleriensis]|uniref:Site-specific DNA recombinase n=1 Tax=Franzmannia pantelleriensis TaxID=48727 RepID=A0A1G9H4X3_9GAMM|nr:recombinase family protein [Halomonas pantelleriensis]SDL08026.1 Site-specific DNA recombinase [Halomonas pantelleriensis]